MQRPEKVCGKGHQKQEGDLLKQHKNVERKNKGRQKGDGGKKGDRKSQCSGSRKRKNIGQKTSTQGSTKTTHTSSKKAQQGPQLWWK